MNKICLIIIISLITGNIYSQNIKSDISQYNWKTFDLSENKSIDRIISDKKAELGLSDKDELLLKSQEIDKLTIEHYRFEQYFNGVRVEGSDYIIHQSADKTWGNGRLVYGIKADQNPNLKEEEALQKALEYIGSEKYYWEDEAQEEFIKWFKDDPKATFYPLGELVFADEQYPQEGENYQLCWKFDIHAHGVKMREYVYVNANDGSIVFSTDAIKYCDSEATAQTHYYGEQTIITDSIASDIYHLEDCTRGGGIITLNLNPDENISAGLHFIDEDNYWDNSNSDFDDVATDAHWSMEMIYDFYWDNYQWNSFDGNGAKMIAKLHLTLSNGSDVPGAFFTGLYTAIGDGMGGNSPTTYIETIGHEFTHGVTYTKSGLVGWYEMGIVNESFSNVLGTAIEFDAIPDQADWIFHGIGGGLAYDMANPNTSNRPDTYKGDYWFTDSTNTGPYTHINMAFMDYWFYLLCEGGNGVNDIGNTYEVDSIGMEKATDIIYRSISFYIAPTSQCVDARQATIQSAIDLYGECSNEVDQVINAWYAVGIGTIDYAYDLELIKILSPRNNCALTNEEIVEVEVQFNVSGCPDIIIAGSTIEMKYKIDGNDPIVETWTLDEDMIEGESYSFSFAETIMLPDTGEYFDLRAWVNYSQDSILTNNSLQRSDIGIHFRPACDSTITFEASSNAETYFYTEVGEYAKAEINSSSENTGTYGFQLGVADISAGPKPMAEDPSLNFESQEEYISKICFCVDASDWDHVSLNFDMKQTYSMLYNFVWGDDVDTADYVSSMRMLINGEQYEEQFHPDSYFDDPYLTYNFDLDELAGTAFEFCFQSKNYVNDNDVPNPLFNYSSEGDNTYLDNIRFSCEEFVGIVENELIDFNIYPNPANDVLYIENDQGIVLSEVSIFNQLGQHVIHISNFTSPVDISMLETGVYIIELRSGEVIKREKLIVR